MLKFLKNLKHRRLDVNRQVFNINDAETLAAMSSTPTSDKVEKELDCELLHLMLEGMANEDFRKGWIAHSEYRAGMVERSKMIVTAKLDKDSDKGEMTSMQVEED